MSELTRARLLIASVIVISLLLLLSSPLQVRVNASPSPDYIVVEFDSGELSRVAPDGTVTLIASGLSSPYCIAVESSGDFIVTERGRGKLSRVTAGGAVTPVATGLRWLGG